MSTSSFSLVAIIGLALLGVSCDGTPHIAIVDNQRLFDSFEMKTAYEAELQEMENLQKQVLDSLEFEVRSLQVKGKNEIDPEQTQERQHALVQEYNRRRELFRENMNRVTGQFDQNIWKQIESYMKDFAREKGYDYVLGKSAYDDIYAFPAESDVTDAAIEYINTHYTGTEP